MITFLIEMMFTDTLKVLAFTLLNLCAVISNYQTFKSNYNKLDGARESAYLHQVNFYRRLLLKNF